MRDEKLPATRRLRREFHTIGYMMRIWCVAHHVHSLRSPAGLCAQCTDLLAYAGQRLANCPYGEGKPTCARCPVHCYARSQREQVREVMKHAGPRMLWRHPWHTLLHILDKLRPAELPRKLRAKHIAKDKR